MSIRLAVAGFPKGRPRNAKSNDFCCRGFANACIAGRVLTISHVGFGVGGCPHLRQQIAGFFPRHVVREYRSGAARRLFSFHCLISTEFLTWSTLIS